MTHKLPQGIDDALSYCARCNCRRYRNVEGKCEVCALYQTQRAAPPDPRKDLAARLEEFTPWVIQHADICTYVASDEGPLCDCGYSERRLKWDTLLAEMRGA